MKATTYISNRYFLNDLMPYNINEKTKAKLRIALKEYQMLLNASLEAINALGVQDLHKFDALVGENACQLRAVWIAIITSKNFLNISVLEKQIVNVKSKINLLLEEKTISNLMNDGISLMELFISEKLFISLDFNEFFIIQCFLLTETKITAFGEDLIDSIFIKEKCDPKRLKKFGDISSSFADNLLSKIRKVVATSSVYLARESADKTQDRCLIKMLSDEFTVNHNNHLLCTPMFWTYKAVLLIAKNEGIPLIIQAKFLGRERKSYKVVDEDWLFFEPTLDREGCFQDFIHKDLIETDYNRIAWVVQGIVNPSQNKPLSKAYWRKRFLRYPVSTVILAGAADHRQYPNQEQDKFIHLLQDHEYETFKSFAKSEGFSSDNPTTFFIQHVYPSKIEAVCRRAVIPRVEACIMHS